MPTLIKLKIDVTKLDKNLFFKAKSGAVYADLDFWMNDEDDQYGQCGMIRQDVGAERRKAGEKGNILGNGKLLQPRQPAQAKNSLKPTSQTPTIIEDEDDDIPF